MYSKHHRKRDCESQPVDKIERNCLLTDYLPLVEQCAINVRMVVHCFSKKNDTTCLGKFWLFRYWNVFIGWIKDSSNLKIEADKDWQKSIVYFTLDLMILSMTQRKAWVAVSIFVALGLLLFLNIFLLVLIASVVLLIYIPIMQVNKDLENYCVLNVSHSKYDKRNEKGDVNSSNVEMKEGLVKLITIKDFLFGDIPTSTDVAYNLTERTYINNVVKSIDLSNKYIEVTAVLTRKITDNNFSIYNIKKE